MSVRITTFRGRLTGKGGDQFFLFERDGGFTTTTGTVTKPRKQKFFVHRWTQRGIERLPEFMDIVKAGSPSANAMEFNTVIGLDLPVGLAFAGGKYYLGTRLNVATEGTGAKDGVEKSPFYGQ